ncbi:uncharacterized protein METZ01_LOCUS412106, partial [marine metagenome]
VNNRTTSKSREGFLATAIENNFNRDRFSSGTFAIPSA